MRRLTTLLLPLLALSLSGCGTGPFANPFIQSIEVTLTPSDLTLKPGATGRVQVSGKLATTGAVVTGLTVRADEIPTGLSVTPSTGSIVVTAQADAQEGTYAVPVSATTTGGRGQAVLAITVSKATSNASYTAGFVPSPITLEQGASTRVALQATRGGQATTDVRVVAVKGDLTSSVTPDGLGLTVAASATQQTGAYVLTVTTTDGSDTQTSTIPVTVTTKGAQ
ncbi:hypothetical protein DVJ83_16075 (plasmid) [Deinococcus wulumuqiensis]|uniref:Cell surface protein n=1 Tax=Deinococcus wulumuqiensis TaxID=980427 RepID=A0A345ILU8_9DEIO|nr:putative Ig domain-containing protein [Deinococcus wulumuqiensis]AXH00671.1 hypothetical protein DVJ83_16075 [Deinococcus wulumuqiensis]